MKIALAQLNYHIGNFEANNQKIIQAIQTAKSAGADLVVFAELSIGGYPAKDLLRNSSFIAQCEQSIAAVAQACQGVACIIGAPIRNQDGEGKTLYNAALLLEDGKVSQTVKKSLLPDYDVFDEYRYFEPNKQVNCIPFRGKTIALTVCEDLWDDDGPNSYVGDIMLEIEKQVMLQVLDNAWKDHLATMDHLRQGINLRSYAQRNPKQEYKREAFELFQSLLMTVKRETIHLMARVEPISREQMEEMENQRREELARQKMQLRHDELSALGEAEPEPVASAPRTPSTVVREGRKVGRNDPCPCGSGKKFKSCHGALE